jgi:hypothetical protein
MVQTVTLTGTAAIALRFRSIEPYSETVISSTVPQYKRGTDYTIDYTAGTIARLSAGAITDPLAVTVSYRVLFTLGDYVDTKNNRLLDRIVRSDYPLGATKDVDEASVFTTAIQILNDTLQLYRNCEAVVAAYRKLLADLSAQRDALGTIVSDADALHATIERNLDHKRHEVATARALLADEQQRVRSVNARRDEVVAKHVRFLAYVRPRSVDARLDVPVHLLEPQLADATMACFADHGRSPPEIQAMLEIFRESPVGWFPAIADEMRRLDRIDAIRRAFRMATLRAYTRWQLGYWPWMWEPSPGRYFNAFNYVFAAQRRLISAYRYRVAAFNLAELEELAWEDAQARAHEHLSLGDIADGGHGRNDLCQVASKELEGLGAIATCLHARLAGLLPRIRLDWAEKLSEYSGPVELRNLNTLPRWNDLDYRDRHDLQQHVDWLFAQVSSAAEPIGLVNDLVRVCILLGSHAPVDQIISGHVHEAASATQGGAVTVAIDPMLIRIGMEVAIYTAPASPAPTVRGFVENIIGGLATTRISWLQETVQMIPSGAAVRFQHPQPGYAPFRLR